MNFLVTLGPISSQETSIINASSWSTCLAYCEGTGLDINQIQKISNANIHYNVSGTTNCFQVVGRDSNGTLTNSYVWETSFDTLSTWIDSQSYQSIQTIQFSNKSYVVV